MSETVPFTLLTAFSTKIDGGNPAAVVFIDLGLPEDLFKNIAQNLNQPVTAFVSSSPLPSNDKKVVSFDIRWFTPARYEIALCGHGTLAAAKAIFERADLVTKETQAVELHTFKRGTMTARKLEGGSIEIQIPSANQVEVSPEEYARLTKVLYRAFGKEVAIKHIASSGKAFEHCLMVELDEKENLKELSVYANVLRDTGFMTMIITTVSTSGRERFVSRMFAPGLVPNDEDHVCGFAHSVMTPYWSRKLGIPSGEEIKATQVSSRGGDLKLVWNSDKNILSLSGELAVLGKGELTIA